MKLDIGSGQFHRNDGYVTVDKFAEADVQSDMGDLPFADDSIDAIWSGHALEHVARDEVIPTLQEWFRVLKWGGRCTIIVPDLDYNARIWLEHGMAALPNLFGNQDHEGEFHKTGWNQAGLADDLRSVGFHVEDIVSEWTPDYTQDSIRAEAVKGAVT